MRDSKSDQCAWSLEDLSRRKLPETHLVNKAKGGLLLDLPRMNRDLAIWKPGYLETLTEPSAAALNLAFTSFKARVIALLMAVFAVRPKP